MAAARRYSATKNGLPSECWLSVRTRDGGGGRESRSPTIVLNAPSSRRFELDRLDAPLLLDARDRGRPFFAPVERDDEEPRSRREFAGERFEQRKRQVIGPLQVIDDEQQGSVRGEPDEQVPHCLEGALSLGRRRKRRRFLVIAALDVQPRGLVSREDTDGVRRFDEALVAAPGSIRGPLQQVAEGSKRRPRGRLIGAVNGRERHALARHHFEATPHREMRELRGEERLADAALASDEGDASVPALGFAAKRLDLRHHAVASHEAGPEEIRKRRARRRRRAGFEQGRQDPLDHGCAADPLLRFLGQERGDEIVDSRRHAGDEARGRGVLVVKMRPEQAVGGGRREGRAAHDALVEHAAQRVEIGARVGDAPPHELRREVRERPPEAADLEGLAPDRAASAGQETEVKQDGLLVFTEKHVRRLQIAMDDPLAVHEVERHAKSRENRKDVPKLSVARRRGGRRFARNVLRTGTREDPAPPVGPQRPVEVGEGRPIEELHGVPGVSVEDAVVEEGHDPGMPVASKKSDLLAHGGQQLRARRQDGLDGGSLARLVVDGGVDDAHPAVPEDIHHPVGAESRVHARWQLAREGSVRRARQRSHEVDQDPVPRRRGRHAERLAGGCGLRDVGDARQTVTAPVDVGLESRNLVDLELAPDEQVHPRLFGAFVHSCLATSRPRLT